MRKARSAIADASEATIAATASRALAASGTPDRELAISFGDGSRVPLPKIAVDLLHDILSELALGHAVRLVTDDAELTTQEAAERLNVSRPYLIRLLGHEPGQIPYRKVGAHRRIKAEDLDAYRRRRERQRDDAMQEMADQAQHLRLGY